MTTRITTLIRTSTRNILRLALLGSLVAAASLSADDSSHEHSSPAKLVQIVRDATRPFIDVGAATDAGYGQFLGCVSALVADGEIDATKPEALIYEFSQGRARLVGVEFIVDAATWLANHVSAPVLEGQSFQLVDSPNRYGIPAPFFELHVWAWRDNPNGAFVDWNDRVTCEGQ